jgi:hypothetical protein
MMVFLDLNTLYSLQMQQIGCDTGGFASLRAGCSACGPNLYDTCGFARSGDVLVAGQPAEPAFLPERCLLFLLYRQEKVLLPFHWTAFSSKCPVASGHSIRKDISSWEKYHFFSQIEREEWLFFVHRLL